MKCPMYGIEKHIALEIGLCKKCSQWDECQTLPKYELRKVDIFELAKLLEGKKQDKK